MNQIAVRATLAPIIETAIPDADLSIPLPGELHGKSGFHEVPSGLDPTVEFREPGQYVIGLFRGMKELSVADKSSPTGRRIQWIYYLAVGAGQVVGVWGSTILDRMMVRAVKDGLKDNSSLMIQYTGTVDVGQPSPAKTFRVIWK